MRSSFECIPCIIRQSIEAAKISLENEELQREMINKALHFLQEADYSVSPPELGKHIFRILKDMAKCEDPYRDLRNRINTFVLEQYSNFKRIVYTDEYPVRLAAKLAITSNIRNFDSNKKTDYINSIINNARKARFTIGDFDIFLDDIARSKNILYIADNAGEIVFDKLFIEVLKRFYPERSHKFTVAVRGEPIINDATMEDADMVNMQEVATVIDDGNDAPATILHEVSEEMKKQYDKADLVISKGQGNFESLHAEERLIYFMFKVRCPVISEELEAPEGSLVLKRSI